MTKRELVLQFIRDLFRSKSPIELAEQELLEAQLAKMDAETSVEYYVAMVQYNQKRVDRLIERLEDMYDRQEFISQPSIRMARDHHMDSIRANTPDRISAPSQSQASVERRGL
jgi:hypothetical protein